MRYRKCILLNNYGDFKKGDFKISYYRAFCPTCDSLLEFDYRDMHPFQDGENYRGNYIICPICGTHIEVDGSNYVGEKPGDIVKNN